MENNELMEDTANLTNLQSLCYTPDIEFCHLIAGLNSLSSFLGSIGNLLVCIAVYRTPRLHKNSGWSIFNLAIADLIVTTFAQPTFAYLLARKYDAVSTCAPWLKYLALTSNVIGHYPCGASLANMVALSLDCCIAILKPLKHAAVAPVLLKPTPCLIWVAGGIPVAFLVTNFSTDFRALILITLLSGSYIVVLTCYVLLVITIKKQETIRKQLQVGLATTNTTSGERRLAKTVAIVTGVFTLCWAPFGYQLLSRPGMTAGSLYFWATTFGLCNSAVNPFVYFFRDKNYRQALVQAVRPRDLRGRSCVTPQGAKLPSIEARVNSYYTTSINENPSPSTRQSAL